MFKHYIPYDLHLPMKKVPTKEYMLLRSIKSGRVNCLYYYCFYRFFMLYNADYGVYILCIPLTFNFVSARKYLANTSNYCQGKRTETIFSFL